MDSSSSSSSSSTAASAASILAKQYMTIFVAVASYWIVSISMVFLNGFLLTASSHGSSAQDAKLDAPMFITWFQCLVTVLCYFVFDGVKFSSKWLTVNVFKLHPVTTTTTASSSSSTASTTSSSTATTTSSPPHLIDINADLEKNSNNFSHSSSSSGTCGPTVSSAILSINSTLNNLPSFEFHYDIAQKALSLAAVFVGMIAFNNLCLKAVGVAFYNVNRSLATVFNVIFQYFMLGEKTSKKALLCCGLIVLGFLIGVDQEGSRVSSTTTTSSSSHSPSSSHPSPSGRSLQSFSYFGEVSSPSSSSSFASSLFSSVENSAIFNSGRQLFGENSLADLATGESFGVLAVSYGILASVFVALNSVYVKRVLPVVHNDSWRLTLYNNLLAVGLFLPIITLLGEWSVLIAFPRRYDGSFWLMMTVAGILGISIAVVTANQVKYTSPLTHLVSATAKSCFQTLLAVWLGGATRSAMWWFSNACVLLGSALYTYVKHQEMQVAAAAKARQQHQANVK